MGASPDDPEREAGRLPTGRLARTARVGGLVTGQGLIGLLVTGFLKAAGARVMAVDLMASRRSFCQAMGAEKVVIH